MEILKQIREFINPDRVANANCLRETSTNYTRYIVIPFQPRKPAPLPRTTPRHSLFTSKQATYNLTLT